MFETSVDFEMSVCSKIKEIQSIFEEQQRLFETTMTIVQLLVCIVFWVKRDEEFLVSKISLFGN